MSLQIIVKFHSLPRFVVSDINNNREIEEKLLLNRDVDKNKDFK